MKSDFVLHFLRNAKVFFRLTIHDCALLRKNNQC